MYSLLRTYHPEATTGLFLDALDNKLCITLERPWLDNKRAISCIPEGIYSVKRYRSAKYPQSWIFQNVPDRSLILIHNCNYMEQLKGCVGIGETLKENIPYDGKTHRYWINNSKATLDKLNKVLPESFLLEVRKG